MEQICCTQQEAGTSAADADRQAVYQDPQREAVAEKEKEQEKSIEAAGGKEIQPGKGLNLLEGLNVDNDQLLLLMLAMLLSRNDAPIELILALLYIAM